MIGSEMKNLAMMWQDGKIWIVVCPTFPLMRILIKTDTEVDAASYPGIPKYRKTRSDNDAHTVAREATLCVFFLLSFSKKKQRSDTDWTYQFDRREFIFQNSVFQLARKVTTYIKDIYNKTSPSPKKSKKRKTAAATLQLQIGGTCWWGWTLWQHFDCNTQSKPREMLRGSQTQAFILNERKKCKSVAKIALDIWKRCNRLWKQVWTRKKWIPD